MSDQIEINSDTLLTDINHNFRIFAGPGAGKTYWLINHINCYSLVKIYKGEYDINKLI